MGIAISQCSIVHGEAYAMLGCGYQYHIGMYCSQTLQ